MYRFVILPWELEWKNDNFNTSKGNLKSYEKNKNILLKCFDNISDLEAEAKNYPKEYCSYDGVMLFNKSGNKPKEILRHLRNICAHGNFRVRSVNKRPCLGFSHYAEDKRLRVIGHLPFDEVSHLINAVMTTKVN